MEQFAHAGSGSCWPRVPEEFELWVHQRLGCSEASVVVLATDHRRLLVRLAAPALEIVVFVGHAPDALDEEALYDGWEDTEGLLQKATAGDVPFVMMVEANWRLVRRSLELLALRTALGKVFVCCLSTPVCATNPKHE